MTTPDPLHPVASGPRHAATPHSLHPVGPGPEGFAAPGPPSSLGPTSSGPLAPVAPDVPDPLDPRTPGALEADHRWLQLACDLAALCPPSDTAFSVGAVIVAADGTELSRGHSRESHPQFHAEETALAKLPSGAAELAGATIYTSLEPCAERRSRPLTCTQLILAAGLRRVVLAWREPTLFVAAHQATEMLRRTGIEVVELPELAPAARAVNAHLHV